MAQEPDLAQGYKDILEQKPNGRIRIDGQPAMSAYDESTNSLLITFEDGMTQKLAQNAEGFLVIVTHPSKNPNTKISATEVSTQYDENEHVKQITTITRDKANPPQPTSTVTEDFKAGIKSHELTISKAEEHPGRTHDYRIENTYDETGKMTLSNAHMIEGYLDDGVPRKEDTIETHNFKPDGTDSVYILRKTFNREELVRTSTEKSVLKDGKTLEGSATSGPPLGAQKVEHYDTKRNSWLDQDGNISRPEPGEPILDEPKTAPAPQKPPAEKGEVAAPAKKIAQLEEIRNNLAGYAKPQAQATNSSSSLGEIAGKLAGLVNEGNAHGGSAPARKKGAELG